MIVIAGLGNPGREYEGTRHNAGFAVIDRLADEMGIDVTARGYGGLYGKGVLCGQKVLLLKPMTYMNASGESVRSAADYYRIDPSDELIVVFDDISLSPGEIRIRRQGSAGGHNGVKSLIAHLHTEQFCRIKVGVGQKPPRMDLADYVLGRFRPGEQEQMEEGYAKALSALPLLVAGDTDRAMNEFNRRKRGEDNVL